ncbi:50S ribosomal protein L13 [Candidatus Falkowbacteria bacterium]|nr:50S ribosomal protein L13 [Candidatus Falkowbacteria bacterium]
MATPKVERKIHNIDATGKAVGRLATQIALLLRGKHKPEFQPHLDLGDIVEVKNIDQLSFTGKKVEQKLYYRHSQHPGGLKVTQMKNLKKDNPADILKRAVREMLPPIKKRPDLMRRLIIR